MFSRPTAVKKDYSLRQSALNVTVTLLVVVVNIKDAEGCNKLVYTSVNQETTVHIPLHSTAGPVNGCDVCPGGIAKIESASAKFQALEFTAENEAVMHSVFWNNVTSDLLLDIPRDSSVLNMATEEPIILVDVLFSCVHDGVTLGKKHHKNSTITITLVPVELQLKKDENSIEENGDIHFTCELVPSLNGTVTDINPYSNIYITHNKSHPLKHCVNKTVCEANLSNADILRNEGYYICSAEIKDEGLEHWIHISSQPVFVMIEPDKLAYYGKTIGAPIAACVLFIVATIVVASIVMRHWKRVLQEEWEERHRLLDVNRPHPNAHRDINQDERPSSPDERPSSPEERSSSQEHQERRLIATPHSVVYGTSSEQESLTEDEYGVIRSDFGTNRNRPRHSRSKGFRSHSSRSTGYRSNDLRTKRHRWFSKHEYLTDTDKETTEDV